MIYYQEKCLTKQNIESFLTKIQRNLEFMLLTMVKYVNKTSFPFMSKHKNLYYLKTEQLTLRQFGTMSGYDYGIEDSAIVQIEISEILSSILKD